MAVLLTKPIKEGARAMGSIIPANFMLVVLIVIFVSIILVNVIAMGIYMALTAYIRMKEM